MSLFLCSLFGVVALEKSDNTIKHVQSNGNYIEYCYAIPQKNGWLAHRERITHVKVYISSGACLREPAAAARFQQITSACMSARLENKYCDCVYARSTLVLSV